jgi:hypothetical protein
MEIDKLKLLRGKPIQISDLLYIYQPTIGDIEEFGEAKFMGTFWIMCSCAWDMPSVFADKGIDFMSISDWQFFLQTIHSLTPEDTRLIFGELDFSQLYPVAMKAEDGTEKIVLLNPEMYTYHNIDYKPGRFIIDEDIYKEFIQYIREMIGFVHKGRKAGNAATAKILIMDDRKQRSKDTNKPYESMFHNGLISLVNTEEFPYKYEDAFDLTIYQFTKSLLQIQGKKQACAMLQGSMSGFVDTSGIPSENFQWLYSEEKYNKHKGKTLKSSLAPNGGKLNIK